MLRFCGFVARCDDGYAWENAGGRRPSESEERYAKRRLLKPLGAKFTNWFDPFVDEPALFRIFAKLPPAEDAILAFANKYGDISLNEEAQVAGNSLWEWRQAIDKFREHVEFADALLPGTTKTKRKDAEAIAEFIEPLLMTFPVFMSAVIANDAVDLRGNVFDLTSVLTMQLIESVIERKSYRSCDQCGKPFELTPQIIGPTGSSAPTTAG
jgi:hypothetical protein